MGSLVRWAQQGVFLLNATLSVRAGQAGSHQGRLGEFTDRVIKELSDRRSGLVFMLWGSYAKRKGLMIDKKHLVLEAVHLSPLSANRGGFFGCRHFSQANKWLPIMVSQLSTGEAIFLPSFIFTSITRTKSDEIE